MLCLDLSKENVCVQIDLPGFHFSTDFVKYPCVWCSFPFTLGPLGGLYDWPLPFPAAAFDISEPGHRTKRARGGSSQEWVQEGKDAVASAKHCQLMCEPLVPFVYCTLSLLGNRGWWNEKYPSPQNNRTWRQCGRVCLYLPRGLSDLFLNQFSWFREYAFVASVTSCQLLLVRKVKIPLWKSCSHAPR